MQEQPTVLVGVREIADYMRRGPRVIRRLIREGLPVTLEQGAYMTTTRALEVWLHDRALQGDTKRHRSDTKRHR